MVGCSDDEQAAYYAAGGPDPVVNPRTRALTMATPLQCITDSDFISLGARERSAIYTGLFRQSDVPVCAMVRLETFDDNCAALSLHRPAAYGIVSPDEIRFISALSPAISAVVKASMALGSSLDQGSVATAEDLSGAAVLLGAGLTVVALSGEMETIVRQGTHIRIKQGRLVPACKRAAADLERAIAKLNVSDGGWHGAVPLTFPDADMLNPMAADLCKLPHRSSGPLSRSRVMLVFRRPRAATAQTDRTLMMMFGLTQSEAQVGRLLVSGVQVADIASRRGTSIATVRSQLKAIFSKTGCTRQLELSILIGPHCGSNWA
jgi:DNA-binding CsgD family transcriptional regulator